MRINNLPDAELLAESLPRSAKVSVLIAARGDSAWGRVFDYFGLTAQP
jgi:hypothetical protein